MQGDTYKEMPHSVILIMNGATGFLAEGGMSFGVVEIKLMEAKVFELVDSEAQFPRDVVPPDGESIVMFRDEGHGEVVK